MRQVFGLETVEPNFVQRLISRGLWSLMAALSVAVAVISYRYVVKIGPLGPDIVANLYAAPWLPVHAAAASTALLIGAFQFLPALRRRRGVHRILGRVYGASCIAGAVSGLFLAVGTTAGPIAGAGFGLLAVIWFYVTAEAWRLARTGQFDAHRRWMIRSFALTLAAVTLRLQLGVAGVLGVDSVETYRLIAWSAWVPNLLVAEALLALEAYRRRAKIMRAIDARVAASQR